MVKMLTTGEFVPETVRAETGEVVSTPRLPAKYPVPDALTLNCVTLLALNEARSVLAAAAAGFAVMTAFEESGLPVRVRRPEALVAGMKEFVPPEVEVTRPSRRSASMA